MKPNAERALAGLKDFQRATADYAFRRLWIDDDQVKRFLVADEVGLGKTMVAKGVIAKTVEHLWETDKRIDIVYICSNSQIARQNLSRLNIVGGAEVKHADRLTLLPKVIRSLREQRINFVSFTPGTSFQVGRSGGAFRERVMLFWMLANCWGMTRSPHRSAGRNSLRVECVVRISRTSSTGSAGTSESISTRNCAVPSVRISTRQPDPTEGRCARSCGTAPTSSPSSGASQKVTSAGGGIDSSASCVSWWRGRRSNTSNRTW